MLKKVEKNFRQILCLEDENENCVSVADTIDNGRETAIKYKGKWIIKMGNHYEKIKKCKTVDEVIAILRNVDAEYSEWSNATFEEIQPYNPSTRKDYELKWNTLRAKVEPVFNLLLLVLGSITITLLTYLAIVIMLVWCAV